MLVAFFSLVCSLFSWSGSIRLGCGASCLWPRCVALSSSVHRRIHLFILWRLYFLWPRWWTIPSETSWMSRFTSPWTLKADIWYVFILVLNCSPPSCSCSSITASRIFVLPALFVFTTYLFHRGRKLLVSLQTALGSQECRSYFQAWHTFLATSRWRSCQNCLLSHPLVGSHAHIGSAIWLQRSLVKGWARRKV